MIRVTPNIFTSSPNYNKPGQAVCSMGQPNNSTTRDYLQVIVCKTPIFDMILVFFQVSQLSQSVPIHAMSSVFI